MLVFSQDKAVQFAKDLRDVERIWDGVWPVDNSQVILGFTSDKELLGWIKAHEGPPGKHPSLLGENWEEIARTRLRILGATDFMLVRTSVTSHLQNNGDDRAMQILHDWGEDNGLNFRGLIIMGPEDTEVTLGVVAEAPAGMQMVMGLVSTMGLRAALAEEGKLTPELDAAFARFITTVITTVISDDHGEERRAASVELAALIEEVMPSDDANHLGDPDDPESLAHAVAEYRAKRGTKSEPGVDTVGRPTFDIDGQEFRFN